MSNIAFDPTLKSIVAYLKKDKCHTAILYGSRARGSNTKNSDYDIVGIKTRGKKTRITKKKNGSYWDVFIYSEKELKKLTDEHLHLKDAKVLFEKKNYGRTLVRRIQKLVKKSFKSEPKYEINATKVWAHKQLDRIAINDIHGLYRRTELQSVAISDYFKVRRKRFWGPKASLAWLVKNDPITFKMFERVFKKPTDRSALKKLVDRVYRT